MRTAVNNLDFEDLGSPKFHSVRHAALDPDTEVSFHNEMQLFEFPDLAHLRITLRAVVVCAAQNGDQRAVNHCGAKHSQCVVRGYPLPPPFLPPPGPSPCAGRCARRSRA